MTTLYPRLLPGTANELLDRYQAMEIGAIREAASLRHPGAYFAATGGGLASDDHLQELSHKVRAKAEVYGYPLPASEEQRSSFDREAAVVLYQVMDMVPAEAAAGDVWTFLAVRLLPDVVVWRFPKDTRERWLGRGLVRHALGRLWWQAYTLVDDQHGEADYSLLNSLAESELNQVFERRSIGGVPPLARAVVRTLSGPQLAGIPIARRDVVRDFIKRTRRLVPFTSFLSMSADSLRSRMDLVLHESLFALAVQKDIDWRPSPPVCGIGDSKGVGEGFEAGEEQRVSAPIQYVTWKGILPSDPRSLTVIHLANIIIEVVAVEGPVQASRVFRAVTNSTGQTWADDLWPVFVRATMQAIATGHLVAEGDFRLQSQTMPTLRTPEQPLALIRDRGPRNIDEIPPRELAKVSNLIMRSNPRAVLDELPRLVARFYGYPQTSEVFKDVLYNALRRASDQ
ncbi:DUF6339 family protein [Nonomuraea polychroma]|uniref:DUF6339 family protein n=1 Tax=Nonomuraea polychroma TaxID=46176 RepID=UPI003D949D67